jgi:hypothetical protein
MIEDHRLTKDLRAAAVLLSQGEARYLVDLFYTIQDYRIRSANQVRACAEADEPNELVAWMAQQTVHLEADIKKAMDTYSDSQLVGRWSKSICGIGEILAAGLLAHIDMNHCPTVGKLWAFAGLDPTKQWGKSQKRPWNARLKVLCWKIGESFVKVKGRDNDIYGHVYTERREYEDKRNETGELADQAEAKLERFNIGKKTEAYGHYSNGRLPPGHLHARAKRYAVKLFLSHWHHVAHIQHFRVEPPKPYIIEHGGHTDFIAPPNWPMK